MSEPVKQPANSRRILPQPIETSSRSSKDKARSFETHALDFGLKETTPSTDLQARKRISLPTAEEKATSTVPLNGTSRTERYYQHSNSTQHHTRDRLVRNDSFKRRCFLEPTETIRRRCQRTGSDLGTNSHEGSPATTPSPPRRFTPDLTDTAKRSYRGDAIYARHHSNQSDSQSANPREIEIISEQTHPESRFSYSSLLRRQEAPRHSFRAPEHQIVPSSCSEDSNSSASPSFSPFTSSSEVEKRPRLEEQRRESCDEQSSEYLLSLVAQSARKQLKDRALAAFPTEQVYQPIDHFAIDKEEEDCLGNEKPVPGTEEEELDRPTGLSWEVQYMARHREKADMKKLAMVGNKEAGISTSTIATQQILNTARELQSGTDGDNGAPMARALSPPMLGGDLVFPRSSSPDGTIYGNGRTTRVHQGSPDQGHGGLWRAGGHLEDNSDSGLWMGTCRKANGYHNSFHETFQTGLATPHNNPIWESVTCTGGFMKSACTDRFSSNTPIGDLHVGNWDKGPRKQDNFDMEFHDGFVTQIYNYLSLGYPCVAHFYDHELSKISSIPVTELRQDDLHTDAKGYVSVTEHTAGTDSTGRTCMRWVALRLYIHEWARQQPRMIRDDNEVEAWGTRERRGSWAV